VIDINQGCKRKKRQSISNKQVRLLNLFVTAGRVSTYSLAQAMLEHLPEIDWMREGLV